MAIIASASNDVKFHQWPEGAVHSSYFPSNHDEGQIKSLSWAKDGSWVVLVPYTGSAEIITVRDNVKLLQAIDGVYHPTCAVFQNTTKKNIAVGTSAGQVMVYDVKTRSVKKKYPRAVSTILQLQYNATDSHLAATCSNGEVLVFNSMSCHLSSSYKIPKSETASTICFHRSKRNMLAGGSEEGVVATWDINTNNTVFETQAHQAPVTSIAYSPIRSDMVVTGGLDRRFAFYDTVAKKCILDVEVTSSITALDFSYCGTYLGLGSQSGGIVLYDTRNFSKPLSAFSAHDNKKVRHLLFQKVLLPKENKNNSVIDLTAEVTMAEASARASRNSDSIAMMMSMCDSPHYVEPEPIRASYEDDSFMVDMALNHSQTECESKETMASLKKTWPDVSRKSCLPCESKSIPSVMKQQMASTPKYMNEDFPISTVSPIIAGGDAPLPKSMDQSTTTQKQPPTLNVSAEELKKMMREVVREEVESQVDEFKAEMREQFADTMGHMRRYFLDLQMSIVKEFVSMEAMLNKMNNLTVKEFVCDDFLLNQNNKMLKELDSIKEIMEKGHRRKL